VYGFFVGAFVDVADPTFVDPDRGQCRAERSVWAGRSSVPQIEIWEVAINPETNTCNVRKSLTPQLWQPITGTQRCRMWETMPRSANHCWMLCYVIGTVLLAVPSRPCGQMQKCGLLAPLEYRRLFVVVFFIFCWPVSQTCLQGH